MTTSDPNPHEVNFERSEFVTRSNWNSRIMGLSDSRWGFAITARNQNVFKALIESIWLAAWDHAPLRWLMHFGFGYSLWSKILVFCDGTRAAYLPITEDQARSLYPDDESFDEDWGEDRGWRDDDTALDW